MVVTGRIAQLNPKASLLRQGLVDRQPGEYNVAKFICDLFTLLVTQRWELKRVRIAVCSLEAVSIIRRGV
jgi:hypothetical protein